MKIESVDFFYLSMPKVLDIGDGSQDTLLVRVRAGGYEGWGECEASPLTSIAAYVCPMSHSACKPVKASVIGQELSGIQDISRIGSVVRDAGTVWGADVAAAQKRLTALEDCAVKWLEEPMITGALDAYHELSRRCDRVGLAGGEGCHSYYQAKSMLDYAGLKFIQVDTGRIGGITDAKRVAEICKEKLLPDSEGFIKVPEKPGLGITLDLTAVKKYMVKCEIMVDDKCLYKSPDIFS